MMGDKIKHGCWYVLADGTQCGKKVGYHYELDDDDSRVRVYDPFCPEHMEKSSTQEDVDD